MEPSRELEGVRGFSIDRFCPEGLSTLAGSALLIAPVETSEKAESYGRLLVDRRGAGGSVHFCPDVSVQLAALEHVQRVDLSAGHGKQSVQHSGGRTSGASVSLWCSESFQRFHPPERVREQISSAAFGSSVSLDSCLPSRLRSLGARKNV